ncbi:MAG TPA: phospho-sugar mutase [Bacteroidales bacterium]|nr:phospho-sugar mutase [Bacteroidales bacterium]
MTAKEIDPVVLARAGAWLKGNFDEETRSRVRDMMENNPVELTDAFYRDLEFGTGGLRGIMGAGTNRMNRYTVGMATQGLANYLKKMFPGSLPVKVAVSFDSRNHSREFAGICAQVFAANGFQVYLFDDLRPTPELSFAIRHLKCRSGVMITASHNPKEYNGYKAYWEDGAQLIAPHDENVIAEVQKITTIDDVKWSGNEGNIRMIGREIDEVYLERIKSLSMIPDIIRKKQDMVIVYTPLHGTGRTLVPQALASFGFRNVRIVEEQATADGNFPTVLSPNPEEPKALELAIKKATATGADLVLATDPDADRVGIAVKNHKGEFILLNGNQTAALLFYYVLTKWNENGRLTGREYIVKTIVTTDLLAEIARHFKVECVEVLTGFKFIADIIRRREGKQQFIIGGEESFGYLVGDFVRDKDAVSSCAMIAEAAAWMADQGKTLYDLLLQIYSEFGCYREKLLSVTRKGQSGAGEIRNMMVNYRTHPMESIAGSRVIAIRDLQSLKEQDRITGKVKDILLPPSDVLQFLLEDGSKVSVRPSGTEPKIKFYFGVRSEPAGKTGIEETEALLDDRIKKIITSLDLE